VNPQQVFPGAKVGVEAQALRDLEPSNDFAFYCLIPRFRSSVLVAMFLMFLGCATEPPISEARWRAQKEYEQQWARDHGRIGYIGNAGATASQ
jgi:hypothetical protein